MSTVKCATAELMLQDGDFIQAAFYFRQLYPELEAVWGTLEQLERDQQNVVQYN